MPFFVTDSLYMYSFRGSQWRVCCQRGLPRLVSMIFHHTLMIYIIYMVFTWYFVCYLYFAHAELIIWRKARPIWQQQKRTKKVVPQNPLDLLWHVCGPSRFLQPSMHLKSYNHLFVLWCFCLNQCQQLWDAIEACQLHLHIAQLLQSTEAQGGHGPLPGVWNQPANSWWRLP